MDPHKLSEEEKNKRIKLGRLSNSIKYHTNEMINIKNLKNQFRESTKMYKLSPDDKFIYVNKIKKRIEKQIK